MFYEAVPGRIPDDMQSWFDLGCINNHPFYHPTDGQENPKPQNYEILNLHNLFIYHNNFYQYKIKKNNA